MKAEGIEADASETLATIRQRSTMAMYRYCDKRQVAEERRGTARVWRLVSAFADLANGIT
jgi:hypothetical protein